MSRNLIVLVVVTLSATAARGQSLEQQRKGLDAEMQRINQSDAEFRSRGDSLESESHALNKRASDAAEKNKELEATQRKIEREVHDYKLREQKLAEQLKPLNAAAENLKRDLSDVTSAQQELKQEDAAIDSARRKLDRTSQFQVDRFNERVKKYNRKRNALLQKRDNLKSGLSEFEKDGETWKSQREATNELRRDLADKLQQLSIARAKNHAVESDIEQRTNALQRQREELTLVGVKLRDDKKDLSQRIETWNAKASKAGDAAKFGPRLTFDDEADEQGKSGKRARGDAVRETAQDELRNASEQAKRADDQRRSLEKESMP